jgi:hypothetical protein
MEYDSDAPIEALKSKADEGTALYTDGITQYGTFISTTGNKASNRSTTNDTIRVINRVLQ